MGRTITNNSLVCILEASLLRPEMVIGATKDGKIKIFNINSQSEVEKTLSVSDNLIIELVTI